MWPAALIVGMFVLIGAIGTASAPVAHAADGDICDIVGPFPSLEVEQNDLDSHGIDGKLLLDEEYLFVVQMENDDSTSGQLVGEIDDEEGDADFTAVAESDEGDDGFNTLPNTDNVQEVDLETAANWDSDFIDEVEGFGVDVSALADCGTQTTFPAAVGTAESGAQCTTTGVDDDADGTIDDGCPAVAIEDGLAFVLIQCEDAGRFELTFFDSGDQSSVRTEEYLCVGAADEVTLTATPATVESVPAAGNVSHSLIVATFVDEDGEPSAPGEEVDWTTSRCVIEGLTEAQYETAVRTGEVSAGALFAGNLAPKADDIEDILGGGAFTASDDSITFENDPAGPAPVRTIAAAILHCENAQPGTATVTAEIEVPGPDISGSVDVTVVGPPAFITMTAAPTELVCGEKATILITITDAINQNVSDHTRVELITNFGGVLGGTGSTLGFPGAQPVSPLSSTAAETFGGVATAYLLTSTNHIGAYEVVAASGGGGLGGTFSTPVITSQVTVTCSEGAAPDVTAPDTGTGSISPPNTGDAGLAASSAGTASLFVIAGAVAFVLAGFASFSFARR